MNNIQVERAIEALCRIAYHASMSNTAVDAFAIMDDEEGVRQALVKLRDRKLKQDKQEDV